MKWLSLGILICISACASPAPGLTTEETSLNDSQRQEILRLFDANLTVDLKSALAPVSTQDSERSFLDSDFLRRLLKRNAMRGFECNPDITTLLMKEYGVYLLYSGLESLELTRMTTCPNVSYDSMIKNSLIHQMNFQSAFITQLVNETNNIVKFNERPRSPSGLKFKLLIDLNIKSDRFFKNECKKGSKEHCFARSEYGEILQELKVSIHHASKKSPLFRNHWMPPLLENFFRAIGI
jgi:hypothetical protein